MEDGIDRIIAKIRNFCMKYKYIIFVIMAISVGIYIVDYIRSDKESKQIEKYYEEVSSTNVQAQVQESIVVHIDGAVEKPGVYELPMNSRINDLINVAGGVTKDAVMTNVNLARYVQDGEKIYVYRQGEEEIELQNETSSGKINVNTATKEQLMSLPGIGQTTAINILEYIKSHGKLKNIEDIQNVKGIGESKYVKIKDLIDVR